MTAAHARTASVLAEEVDTRIAKASDELSGQLAELRSDIAKVAAEKVGPRTLLAVLLAVATV